MIKNIINKKYGKLTAIKFSHTKNGKRGMWLCKCDCGNEKIVRRDMLLTGSVSSCGCSKPKNKQKHPLEYSVWKAMRKRCNNKNSPEYYRYGDKGINVCKEWNNFNIFLKDMGPRPSPSHSIDRINNNKGYSKENCRWATPYQQANNKSNNHFITINENTKTLAEWLRIYNITKRGFYLRIQRGLTEEALITSHKTWRK